MHFNQSLLDLGLSPLLSQERLDALCASTPVPPKLRVAIDKWTDALKKAQASGSDLKEMEHERQFMVDIFEGGLGYKGPGSTAGSLNIRYQFNTSDKGGKPMDGVLGSFANSGADSGGDVSVVIEAKGSDCKKIDTEKSNGLTAPEQAFRYATICQRGTPKFVIVTNLAEIRLYRFDQRITRFWRFDLLVPTAVGEDPDRHLRELAYLLAPERLLPEGGQRAILDLQLDVPEEAAPAQVAQVHLEIEKVIEGFQKIILSCLGAGATPTQAEKDAAWMGGQKIVARMLFTGFANKHGLLQPNLLNDCQQATPHPLNRLSKWDGLMHLFRAMDTGFQNGERVLVPHFNGGLFKETPDLDDLRPKPGPLLDEAIEAAFNLARNADLDSGSTLLGQIFEQGLKRFEARTLAKVQDGIVYTPEHIGRAVTVQTLKPLIERAFADADASLGGGLVSDPPELLPFHQFQRRWNALAGLRVIDPACGSGAFLAAALHYLKFVAMEGDAVAVRHAFAALPEAPSIVLGSLMEAMEGGTPLDPGSLRGKAIQILRARLPMESAIYGVDLHIEAVTYAKLSVWLKGVEREDILQQLGLKFDLSEAVLPNLDEQILVGDSMVDASAWAARFPAAFASGGFDAVLGNPPYVKTSNLKDDATKARIKTIWSSVATGQFDLYIPFIDLGLNTLLTPQGRMGMITPSIWSLAEYGELLRTRLHAGRNLEGVVHFRDYQVFEGVTNYTALWFFTKTENPSLVVVSAPEGIAKRPEARAFKPILEDTVTTPALRWRKRIATMPPKGTWPFLDPITEWVIQKARRRGQPFSALRREPFRGFSTDLNGFFFIEPDRKLTFQNTFSGKDRAKRRGAITIEAPLVNDLIKADSIQEFGTPAPECKVIFPYAVSGVSATAIGLNAFPHYKVYATLYENDLKERAKIKPHLGKATEASHPWWCYGTPQSLDKVGANKLVYFMTGKELTVGIDFGKALIDQRCYGIPFGTREEGFFLLGILNATFSRWYIKQVSKPKTGDSSDIEKQFVMEIPVPKFTPTQRVQVARLAAKLHVATNRKVRTPSDGTPASNSRHLFLDGSIAKWKAQIDALIYAAFGFTTREITRITT